MDPAPDLRLVPAALTCWVVTAAGITWSVGRPIAALCAAAAALWLAARRRGAGGGTLGTGLLVVTVIGAGFGLSVALRTDAVGGHPLRPVVGATVEVTLVPVETARPVGSGRLMFRAGLTEVNGRESAGTVTVIAPTAGYADVTAGRPARLRARVAQPARRDLTVATLIAVGRPTVGEAGAIQRAAARVRDRFAAAARSALPADQAAILPGLVLGDTTALTTATAADFRTAGLTHLTAVSGANVTIVCGAVLLLAGLIGPRAAVALAAGALIVFVVVVTPTPSVLRAAVMGALALVALVTARRRQAIPILAATVIALLAFAPQLAVDLGFALSVSATAAIVLLAPRWSDGLTARGWPEPLAAAVAVALAAQLVTAPLIAAVSGRFSVIAVIANLLVAPVIPPVTVLGTLAAALASLLPAVAGLLIRFTGPELWWLLRVAQWSAALPGASVPTPSGFVGATAIAALMAGLAWSVSRLVGRT